MRIDLEHRDGFKIISILEDIDFYNTDELEKQLGSYVSDSRGIIISLKNVRYIDSSGLGVLTNLLRKCRENDISLILAELSADVRNIFELTRLIDFFHISRDVEQALASLTGN